MLVKQAKAHAKPLTMICPDLITIKSTAIPVLRQMTQSDSFNGTAATEFLKCDVK